MLTIIQVRKSYVFSAALEEGKLQIYTTIALYGCETWSFTFREEHRGRVFENGGEGNIWA
jgi:hypothetical protein